jgi:hypothetical protein
MKTWPKALGIACAVEIPLLAVLIELPAKPPISHLVSTAGQVLTLYHMLSIPFGMSAQIMWNPGTRPEPAPGSAVVFWSAVYVAQIALTMPIVALFLKIASYFRSRSNVDS